jgi:reticulon-4-interacting protein 1 homolog, mitochondrial
VLVLGGSGGVGTLAIQLLKYWGASVTSTCCSQAVPWLNETVDLDDCVDYSSGHLETLIERFDLVLDCVKRDEKFKIDPTAMRCLKKGNKSKYVSINSSLLHETDNKGIILGFVDNLLQESKNYIEASRKGVELVLSYYVSSQAGLRYLTHLVEEEKMKPIINQVYQFDNLPEAYIKVQEGHLRGKIVIQIQ